MNIRLENSYVSSLKLNKIKEGKKGKKNDKFIFSYSGFFSPEKNREFKILFNIKLSDNKNFNIVLEFVSVFSTDEEIDENYMQEKFVKINAPAIAYPFLRSFIATLLVNSGYPPVILPTINFVKLYEKGQ